MSSSVPRHFGLPPQGGAAAGGDEDDRLLHLHHQHHWQQETYHVPQHSRREKLRFAPDGFPPPPRPVYLVQHHQPAAAATSSSPRPLYNSTMCNAPPFAAVAMPEASTRFMNHTANPLASTSERQTPPQHSFSLSLSSATPSPMALTHQPKRHQLQQQYDFRPAYPLGPFTGYAAVLNRSSFLEPAQKLLEELCGAVSHGVVGSLAATDCGMPLDADFTCGSSSVRRWNDSSSAGEAERLNPRAGQKQCWRSNKLVCILDEVCKRYKQYYQQVHDVITSFECVAGLSTAAPYAFMALKVMAKNFGSLKSMILDQLSHMNMALEKGSVNEQEVSVSKTVNDRSCLQKSANNSRSFNQTHLWRPQRGLPEPALSVLRAWLFEHFLHPYPTDTDKQMLAKQTGLTRNQVSNWFINARVRLWKPMVEEVHSLESQQKHKSLAPLNCFNTDEQFRQPPEKITRTDENSDISNKRNQHEVDLMPNSMTEHGNLSYIELYEHQYVGGGGTDIAKGNNGVSLTLGLHQNNVVHFAEQLPVNAAHRFGLAESVGDSYTLNTYATQGRSFVS